jgi:hypothetical protein
MRFAVGQVYESDDGHKAIVTEIRDAGRAGLLRIDGDASRVEWCLLDDLHPPGKWHLVGPTN